MRPTLQPLELEPAPPPPPPASPPASCGLAPASPAVQSTHAYDVVVKPPSPSGSAFVQVWFWQLPVPPAAGVQFAPTLFPWQAL